MRKNPEISYTPPSIELDFVIFSSKRLSALSNSGEGALGYSVIPTNKVSTAFPSSPEFFH